MISNNSIDELTMAVRRLIEELMCGQRPSAVFRPSIRKDGNKWCALYGANLQEGVAGFGDSPAAAMHDFDRNWNANI